MKRKDYLNYFAFEYSKYKLKKSFKFTDFDSIYNFAQNYVGRGYFDRISLNQFKEEFRNFATFIKSEKPKVVVEIGTKKGGSFFMWARYLKPEHLISIDLPGGIHGGGFPEQKVPFLKYFLSDVKDSKVSIITGDSHEQETFEKLRRILNNEKIDFLFIDGDHRYVGVKKDFEMYKPLVKKGGVIGFHDIIDSEYHHKRECFVDKLWNEIKNDYEYKEFIQSPSQHKYGIGALKIE